MVGHHLVLGLTCYVVTGLLVFVGLLWRWRGTENGLRPSLVGLFWPATLVVLTLYYVAAVLYTLLVVRRGRRLV